MTGYVGRRGGGIGYQLVIAQNSGAGLYANLAGYALFYFLGAAVSTTLSLPCGVFAPVFAAGAGFGRLFGVFVVSSLQGWCAHST